MKLEEINSIIFQENMSSKKNGGTYEYENGLYRGFGSEDFLEAIHDEEKVFAIFKKVKKK
jgi:hypothetical protein